METQMEKLAALLSDGQAHRTDEICARVYGDAHLGLARVGARVWDLKKRGWEIKSWKDKRAGRVTGLHWYKAAVQGSRFKVQGQGQEQAGETPALPRKTELFDEPNNSSRTIAAFAGR